MKLNSLKACLMFVVFIIQALIFSHSSVLKANKAAGLMSEIQEKGGVVAPKPSPKPRSTPRRIPKPSSTVSQPSATPTKSTPTPTPVPQPTPTPSPVRTTVQLAKGKPDTAPLPLHAFEFETVTLDADGKVKSPEIKTAYQFTEDLGGGVKLEMVAIPPGEFTMGTPESDSKYATSERPIHRVRIDYWYYLGRFEVTQAQWRSIMGTNPSKFKDCDRCPVETVSWDGLRNAGEGRSG